MCSIIIVFLVLGLGATTGQRTVPGVPPQTYRQAPPQYQQHHQNNVRPGVNPQQYQQPQMQQMQPQQVPVQQQPPVQQVPMHQQVPVQQVPPNHGGGHHAHHDHHGPHQVLNTGNIQHEIKHIQEHMPVPIDTSQMTEQELQFHYFKMHDTDGNSKLDGCELIKSLIHWHEVDTGAKGENADGKAAEDASIYTDEKLEGVVDYILETMDFNMDGLIDYVEYRKSEESTTKGNK